MNFAIRRLILAHKEGFGRGSSCRPRGSKGPVRLQDFLAAYPGMGLKTDAQV